MEDWPMERELFHMMLVPFAEVFSQPSFANFLVLLEGWLRAGGRAMTSTALTALETYPKHFVTYYRFFSQGAWEPDALGTALIKLVLPFTASGPLLAVVDDTLARKTGKNIWGANMHHDPLHWLPNALAFGHNWVVLAVVIQVPLVQRPVAVPVLWRLYRSNKTRAGKTRQGRRERKCVGAATKTEYRTRPELAVEMLHVLRAAVGPERLIHALGDSAYGGKSVTRCLPANTVAISRVPMNAALYALPPARRPGQKGSPRKKGQRLPNPKQMAARKAGWRTATVSIYGKQVRVRYKTAVVLWYNSTHTMPVRIVLVRDPKGRRKDDCFFSTDPRMSPEAIIETYACRWSIEVAFRDSKQLLGFERSQARTAKAVQRTGPFALLAYTVTVAWFVQHGHQHYPSLIPKRPWYRHKRAASFADMLCILQTLLTEQDFSHTPVNISPFENKKQSNTHAIKRAA